MLVALARAVDPDLLERVADIALEAPIGGSTSQELKALADRLDESARGKLVERIKSRMDGYYRAIALGALAPFMTEELRANTVAWAMTFEDYAAGTMLDELIPHVRPDEAMRIANAARPALRSAILKAFPKDAPGDLLLQAFEQGREIADDGDRRAVLESLWPALRRAGLKATLERAIEVALGVGDTDEAILAQVALLPRDESDGEAKAQFDRLRNARRRPNIEDRVARAAALLALSTRLPSSTSPAPVELAESLFVGEKAPEEQGLTALGVIAMYLPSERGKPHLERALRQAPPVAAVGLAMTAAPEEVPGAFAALQCRVETEADAMDKESLMSAIAVATAAATMDGDRLRELFNGTDNAELLVPLIQYVFPREPGPMRATDLFPPLLGQLAKEQEPEARAGVGALLSPYLPTELLWPHLDHMLQLGATMQRPALLFGLAIAQGLPHDVLGRHGAFGGNRIPDSPLLRLGGPAAVEEARNAIEDVTSWWP
jgi:hypothetical protein